MVIVTLCFPCVVVASVVVIRVVQLVHQIEMAFPKLGRSLLPVSCRFRESAHAVPWNWHIVADEPVAGVGPRLIVVPIEAVFWVVAFIALGMWASL